jgi:hypothetical protein
MPFASGVAEMQSMNRETIIYVNTYSMIYLDTDALDSQVVLMFFLQIAQVIKLLQFMKNKKKV